MTLKRKASGSFIDIATTVKRKAGGTWIDVQEIKRRAAGAWVTVWKRISLSNTSAYNSRVVGTAVAGYRLNSTGVAEILEFTTYTTVNTWLGAGSAGDYEARATDISGTLSAGTTDTWLALSTAREWSVSRGVEGTSTVVMTVEIRNASTLSILATATVDLTADKT